ncbi:MAG: uncharacterized protein JWO78_1760 [Micavibrio sp.]|nr:uncharacterized protein [Micavibrio sp.]
MTFVSQSKTGAKKRRFNLSVAERSRRFCKKKPSFVEVNAQALEVFPSLLARWLPEGKIVGQEYIALNPTRDDENLGSFKINLKTGRWCDFATDDKGSDIISLAAYLFRSTQGEALRFVIKTLEKNHD